MQKRTKIALIAGALALAGTAGFATLATADYGRGSWHGGGHHWRGHGGHGYYGWHKGRRIERMLERFDADKDGKLTQDELNASRKTLLERHDVDKDGKLSQAEFKALGMEVMERRMVRGFQRLDEDGDAGITLEEFQKPYSRAVERMDRDDDGAISRDDRKYRHWNRKDDDDRRGQYGRGGPKKG
jgi:Ca2+-binding EF-hand superfamily protein